jgi:Na+/proline symporter
VGQDAGLGAPEVGPEAGSRVADRKAQRAARRTRRTLAIVCGVVVAVCLILTILIVDMARNRTSGPLLVMSPVALSTGPSRPPATLSLTRFHPIPGAPASEGGNP